MQKTHAVEKKPKGIIVCDTSTLLRLMTELPAEAFTRESYQQNPLPNVFDGLIFLAKHGYEVVIPEMIAREMGDYMRDGETLNQHYPNSYNTAFSRAMGHRAFFREIARLQKDGISIGIQPPWPEDTSPEAKYLNQTYHIHSLPISDYKKRYELSLLARKPKGGQTGDNQVRAYVAGLPVSETPVYILADDVKLQHSFSTRDDVNALGSAAFYESFKREGFLNRLGINADGFDFYDHCHDYYAKYNIEITRGASSDADAKSGYGIDLQKEPFAAAMKQLAEEIAAQSPPANDHPTLTVEGGGEASKPALLSQMDKWAQRAKKTSNSHTSGANLQ